MENPRRQPHIPPHCAAHKTSFDATDTAGRLRPKAGARHDPIPLITPVLIAGCVILMLGFSIRASFGVFQIPIASEFGWARSEFSLAIAIQNLAWGIGQPIFGALAERFGDRRAIVAGALTYAAGLVLSSFAVTPGAHQLLEILVGFGIAGTGFGVVLAVVGRAASPENRSMALGVATAAGSLGQVFGAPLAEILLQILPMANRVPDLCGHHLVQPFRAALHPLANRGHTGRAGGIDGHSA